MVSVSEATQILNSVSFKLMVQTIRLEEADQCVLAEEIRSDRDLPPFNRVAMDGVALASKTFKKDHLFTIEATQPAGSPQLKLQDPANCIKVMTGAMLPENTDTVIPFEETTIESNRVRINLDHVPAGLNIHKQGVDSKKDDLLLPTGQLISPAEVAMLASVGKPEIKVFEFPKTAIISTGDELVDVHETPKPYQIRRSNTYALQAAMKKMGWHASRFHVADNKDLIRSNLSQCLNQNDILILSGGVSKGEYDFIPSVLHELGIHKLFHNISQRPGKPFWFGVSNDHRKVVFALPGNPVSTFLNFYRYVKPWMYKQMGITEKPKWAILASDFNFQPKLTYFLQVKVQNEQGQWRAYPIPGGGSGDFVNLNLVDGFLELPLEKTDFKAGEVFPFLPFR